MALRPRRDRGALPRRDRARAEWVIGMQSRNGGWGAFDADNTHYYLNNIPFADHGALLDPPTADVTARCLGMLARSATTADQPAVARARSITCAREQEADGSWFGRWGMNYIYGTWSVLMRAERGRHQSERCAAMRRAVDWLIAHPARRRRLGRGRRELLARRTAGEAPYSTASQTAWALLGADGGRRGRQSGRRARHRLSDRDAGPRTATGTSPGTRRSGSRACSICAITATGHSSRYGRWRATAAFR